MIEFHSQELYRLKSMSTNCIGCTSFNKTTGFCNKWKATVPDQAQIKGCDDWVYDDIPFN